jgi:hypothetical protein
MIHPEFLKQGFLCILLLPACCNCPPCMIPRLACSAVNASITIFLNSTGFPIGRSIFLHLAVGTSPFLQ